MPTIEPADMLHAIPLPGWRGRFFHTGSMTFAHYDLAAEATPLHEHHHEQEEVWNVVSGEVELTIDGESVVLGPGAVAAIRPNTPHSARAITACSVIVVDHPRRPNLPGIPPGTPVPDLA